MINGEKYYISGAGDPRCKIMITMVQTSPDAPAAPAAVADPGAHRHARREDPRGRCSVFGEDDAPHGHMHIRFDNVRVPKENMLLGEGRGFEISQVRLGPGRIHHCMRSIGQAEKALDLMVTRGLTREAFGKPLVQLGGNLEIISRARIEIEAMRLMVLKAAKAMDVLGNREARVWVHMVKAMVPERVCQIIDQAIQMHGATGVSQWTPLAAHVHQPRAPCASPTARTRSTTWWSAATSCASTRASPKATPSPAPWSGGTSNGSFSSPLGEGDPEGVEGAAAPQA